MGKQELNEGLLGALMNTVFSYAAAKQVDKDPEIQEMMKKYKNDLTQATKEAEDAINAAAEVMSKHTGVKRPPFKYNK